MSLLRLSDVSRRFGGVSAVDQVSFEVAAGGVSAIIGPNGAGKTTLFNLISGFLAPDHGRIELDGRDITAAAPHDIAAAGVVRTFQLVQLFGELSVLQNVMAGFHLSARGGVWSALARPTWVKRQQQEIDARARELLIFVGLSAHEGVTDSTALAERAASALSYGQQRLLEVARALAAQPKLLLLDEPAAGLNPSETEHLAEVIQRIAARGITVLLIEHDMNLVMRIASRIRVLDFGRKIADGAPDEIQRDKAVLAAYLGDIEVEPA